MFAWTEKDWIRCVFPIEALVHLACRRLSSIGVFKKINIYIYIYMCVYWRGLGKGGKRQISRSRPARP